MVDATAERPTTGDTISSLYWNGGADGTSRAGDKCARVSKPSPRNTLWQVAGNPAHACAIAHDPTDRRVKFRYRLDDLHEVERRKLRATQALGYPQSQQVGVNHGIEDRLRQAALAVQRVAMLFHEGRQTP